jgi:NAD(P)-dependent dehydrogenase (short-subunit alcohol dehydrogenase family)
MAGRFFLGFLHRQLFVTPPTPDTSFHGKTIIVTGGNAGLGLEAARWVVKLGASRVILACRNVEKGQSALKDIQSTTECSREILDVWPLDMKSVASVKAFADRAKTTLPRLDVLLANAGVATVEFRVAEKYEESLTVNVINLFLLGLLLYPKLRDTAKQYKTRTRITITTSETYEIVKFQERKEPVGQIFSTLNKKTKANMTERYFLTKMLEILMVQKLGTLLPVESSYVVINCVAPGYVLTYHRRESALFIAIR